MNPELSVDGRLGITASRERSTRQSGLEYRSGGRFMIRYGCYKQTEGQTNTVHGV